MTSFYYAVIFSSQRTSTDGHAYEKMADRMLDLAKSQNGFLGMESARGQDGFGITVSYWKCPEDIAAWKANSEHRIAQELGKSKWYEHFTTRICRVEREYSEGGNPVTPPARPKSGE